MIFYDSVVRVIASNVYKRVKATNERLMAMLLDMDNRYNKKFALKSEVLTNEGLVSLAQNLTGMITNVHDRITVAENDINTKLTQKAEVSDINVLQAQVDSMKIMIDGLISQVMSDIDMNALDDLIQSVIDEETTDTPQ